MRELRDIEGLHPRNLTRRQRLLVVYVISLVATVLAFTVIYYVSVHRLEGRDYTIFRAFQTVVETMTTTGYGADSPWSTPLMNLVVVTMQVGGIVIGLVTLRVLVIPLYEQTSLNLDERLTVKDDHVVVAEYRQDTGVLLDELETLDVDYVLLDTDRDEAKRLSDAGYQAIVGDPERQADLDRATIDRASLLITDAGERTASVVLTALEANDDLRVVSFTESNRRSAALAEVGVDRSVAPHALIGRRLAEKAATPVVVDEPPGGDTGPSAEDDDAGVSTEDDGADPPGPGDAVAIREVLVRRDSPLHGVRVGDSPLASHPDLTLVAGWFDGELRLAPSPDQRLTPDAVLLVAGPEQSIDEVSSELSSVRESRTAAPTRVVVAGSGEGGSAAVDALPDDATVTSVDQDADADPDVVGDVTEPETLREAGVEDASALVVTVDDDATALMTVAMARALADDIEILARVTDAEKTGPAFRAGADYVLSVQRVSARLVAAEAHDERVMDPVGQIRLIRADAAPFAGETLGDLRRETDRGWTVVAVSKGGTVLTDRATTVAGGDDVFVAGTDESIQAFESEIGGSS